MSEQSNAWMAKYLSSRSDDEPGNFLNDKQGRIDTINQEINDPANVPDLASLLRERSRLGDAGGGGGGGGNAGRGIPIDSPQAKELLAQSAAEKGGALSQVAQAAPPPEAMQQQQTAQPGQGALSAVMATLRKPLPTVDEMMQKYVPQDDSSSRYLAMAAALGRPTGFGSFGEKVSNVADALNEQKMQQQKLRLEYLPHIMQTVASQQQMEFTRAQSLAGYDMMNQAMGGQQGPAGQGGQMPSGNQGPQGGAMPQGTPPQGMPTGQPQEQSGAPGAPPMAAPPMQQGTQQPQMATGAPTNGLRYGLNPMEVGADMAFNGGKGFPGMIAKRTEPTPLELSMMAAGIRPGTQEWTDNMRANVNKSVAPSALGRNNMYDPKTGQLTPLLPAPEDGHVWVSDPTSPMGFKQVQSNGGLSALSNIEKARLQAKNTQTIAGPDQSPYNADGTHKPVTVDQVVNGTAGSSVGQPSAAPGASENSTGSSVSAPMGVGKPAGMDQNAVNKNNAMEESWKGVAANNRSAQGVISNLDNIIKYAPGAITGAGSDQLQMLNGLLSFVNKHAETVQEATQLLKKNSAQVVSKTRMGLGGGSSDAFQASLEAGTPNYQMIAGAIQEASQQAKSTLQMNQDKASYVLPHYLSGNPSAYIPAEVNFDKLADPRIWQMRNMDPKAAAAFIGSFPPGVAGDLAKKKQELKDIGVFK